MNERITMDDSELSAVAKMAEGNIGATSVCARLLQEGAQIDPQAFLGGLGAILGLDTLNIYGSRIWMLYKDVCKEDLTAFMAVLRAHQLGYITAKNVHHTIDNRGEGLDIPLLVTLVKEKLEYFGRQDNENSV